MIRTISALLAILLPLAVVAEDDKDKEKEKIKTFGAYVDSDLCARLMVGPIVDSRVECSRTTYKDGSNPVLVRADDNFVFAVNKDKLIKEYVGGFVEATGEPKEKDGTMKLASVKSIEKAQLQASAGARELFDVRLHKSVGDPTYEKIRHELAMMPYISEFDFISFSLIDKHVILTGWTVRITNRSTAQNLVKKVEGVEKITNNIEVLPMGSFDMRIRSGARAALQRMLSRYFWGSGSAIKIIVKNGNIILLGTVSTKADSDTANIQCNTVPGAFKVFNLLRVEPAAKK